VPGIAGSGKKAKVPLMVTTLFYHYSCWHE